MPRYLLNFSYIGTAFSGAQRLIKAVGENRPDCLLSINGRLEKGLKELNPQNVPMVVGSSRTDAGVHALNTTCHVDLHKRIGIYEPDTVTVALNKYFLKEELPIRIIRTRIVSDDFHCRHRAVSRIYMYRMMISMTQNKVVHLHHIPIEELDRCHVQGSPGQFDVNTMREAAKLFEGLHDFRTFMGKTEKYKLVTRRYMHYVKIVEKEPPGYTHYSWPTCTLSNPADYVHLDVYFKAKGFLYRQVRRTVGVLIAAAQGKISLRDVRSMLEVPAGRSWLPQCKCLPAKGLYLCRVEYSEEDEQSFR